MNILTDFCNIDEFTVGALDGFFRRHDIKHTLQGDQDGMESFVVSERIPDVSFYFTNLDRSKNHVDEETHSISEENKKIIRSYYSFPGEDGYNRIFKALEESQAEYRDFLGRCIKGNLDLGFVNSRIAAMTEKDRGFDMKFMPGETTWTPNLWLFPKRIRSIEEHIDIYGIIFPLYSGEGEMFSLTKVCRHCGKYFFAKTKRAEFCSDQCRKDYFRLNK